MDFQVIFFIVRLGSAHQKVVRLSKIVKITGKCFNIKRIVRKKMLTCAIWWKLLI